MTDRIVPLSEAHFEGLRAALDIVAREKRYLAFQGAPPLDAALVFYRGALAADAPHFVALVAETVSGWCDIVPTHGESRAHVGTLGIALVPAARGRGLGKALLQAAIAKACDKGLTRIELTVRADNRIAEALYRRHGFEPEGVQRRAFLVDGVYHDAIAMALLR